MIPTFLLMNPKRTPLKLYLITGLSLLLFSNLTYAQRQRADTGHYRTEPVPAHLMPIERAYGSSSLGSVYFYGGKRLSSPYSLEIPFYEVGDPAITHHFKVFRTMTTLSRFTALLPLAYILIQNKRNNGTYWSIYGGSIVASLTFSIVGNVQVNKAVTRYNELLRQPRVGLSVAPVPLTGRPAIGAGVAWRFR
ncbi:hypothetical protein [Spirosoma utsteinense]|uniref:DUF5683 domain-containing protein n=1 Tax=Spirosoma utsteinense TaxID=2585773 RepID=A0ABR6WCA1_9BACT|nr:hypothetical protein [Spirosoma utsteinense]MBC3783865.1 hypothetical protein [Spirosoma utsteinense]MBC3793556.1 hypothetical protein [Spirosoma utsteinense]